MADKNKNFHMQELHTPSAFEGALWACLGIKGADTIFHSPPTGSIIINNKDKHTAEQSVELTLSAEDAVSGLDKMQFSNDNSSWSEPEAYSTTKNWTLGPGAGKKTVYVKFKDKAGNWSAAFLSEIFLVRKVPEPAP